ncbi:Flavin-dependent monooxygenase, reductase subunit HsaB [Variovorax sp. PBL-H6]|uniref:flavin reductase n=1 Tax=Variovorax sp. PBL-H6 TaxID=434009 RepID=UPI001315C5A7|nr:flavin reductase [Variovorax sp. PBL-H6]VTU28616.1 Flavin-dependent monooxygenase, reductase subunit HsaB [Variovorax sp. PBL-H6]
MRRTAVPKANSTAAGGEGTPVSHATPHISAIEPKLFRQLLGCFPTGVAVITTHAADGRPVGLTCNSFSSVSLEPPLVLFSLRKASSLLRAFVEADSFAINILSQNQDLLSARFASSKIIDKFEGVAWRPGPLGTPLIDDCLASFECRVHARHEAGDHEIFIGEVKHMATGSADHALVFYKGAYMMLAESLRKLVLEGQLGTADIDEAYRALYGTLLRLACERASDAEVDSIEAAADEIEQHQGKDALPQRIEATARFFSSIALAGHNEALRLMAQTMTAVLRERMTHVIPVRPRPDAFPLRRKVVQSLRARDAEGAANALDALIAKLRQDSGAQDESVVSLAPAQG